MADISPSEKFSQLIRRVRDTQAEEIDCSACLDQVSQYVDLELAHGDPAERMPQVKQHLEQCGVCFEEYQLLRDLARMEQAGRPPVTGELKDQLRSNSR